VNIAHIQGIFSPEHGGPTQSLTNYCRNQAAAGHRVSVWALEGFPNTSPAVRFELPIEMNVFPLGWPGVLGRSRSMRKHLAAAETPDIYHLHGTWLRAMHYGAVEARRRKVPCILETMGMYEAYGLQNKWLRKRVARFWFQDNILHNADCLHVGSRQEGDQLRRLGFTKPMAIIPVGVDLQQIERLPRLSSTDALHGTRKAELLPGEVMKQILHGPGKSEIDSILNDRPFILYLARIHEKKGLGMLLKAWAELEQIFPEHILVVGGSGTPEYEDQCRRAISDLGISGRCLWLGRVSEEEKSWAYANASFYVLPSYSENYGNTIAEALAHGTPVITTTATPWSDFQRIGCGWVVPPDLEPLRSALREALNTSPEQLRSMGDRGRRWAGEEFSLASVIRKIDETYLWLTKKGEKPRHVV
jgi:glycosyltransferase involved in cell wall biosynthesis